MAIHREARGIMPEIPDEEIRRIVWSDVDARLARIEERLIRIEAANAYNDRVTDLTDQTDGLLMVIYETILTDIQEGRTEKAMMILELLLKQKRLS